MPKVDFQELGGTGLNRQHGVIYEEFLRELRGDRWTKVVREMSEQDPVVHAILYAIEMLMRQVPVEIEPGTDDAEGQEIAEFVEGCLGDMSSSWADTLSEILSMLSYGWAYQEIVYKRRNGDNRDPSKRSKFNDGRIGWRKWSIRGQDSLDRWQFDDNGGVQGMWQRGQGMGQAVFIPIEKALLFRTTSRKNSPEGRSVLRGAYRPWYFKKHIENIEGIGIERDLAGLPVAHVPPEYLSTAATADQQSILASIKEIVVNIRRDEQEGVVWPLAYDEDGNEMFKLELLSSGGERQFDTDKIIGRYDQRISMTVMADFILLGHEAVGSYALSATKSSLFKTALESWCDAIAAVANTHAIPRLLKLNGWQVEEPPLLKFGTVGKVSLEELMLFVDKFSAAGGQLFPSMETENHLRGEAGLPLLTEEEMQERKERQQEQVQPQEQDQMSILQAAIRQLERGY